MENQKRQGGIWQDNSYCGSTSSSSCGSSNSSNSNMMAYY